MVKLREELARRLNKTQEVKHNTYPVRQMAEQLLMLSDEQLGRYAFLHEPLKGKFDTEQKNNYIRLANECGQQTANEMRSLLQQQAGTTALTIEELPSAIAEELGISIKEESVPCGDGHVIFAQFVEPDQVMVFSDCLDRLNELVRREQMDDLFSGIEFRNVLLAHELFHAVEHRQKDHIFTQTEKIELWKRPFSNKSTILALSEMAAMAFAREICCLSFSPYVLDVLLIVQYSLEAACALYEEIRTAADVPLITQTGE